VVVERVTKLVEEPTRFVNAPFSAMGEEWRDPTIRVHRRPRSSTRIRWDAPDSTWIEPEEPSLDARPTIWT
jgi:hypothetical protein